jgi:2,3,4,5-tetrahydropyridine-2-carboxylate N-succinyltransferase
MTNLQSIIETAWDNRALLQEETTQNAIREVVDLLDNGTLRVAEPVANGWQVNDVFPNSKNGNFRSWYF